MTTLACVLVAAALVGVLYARFRRPSIPGLPRFAKGPRPSIETTLVVVDWCSRALQHYGFAPDEARRAIESARITFSTAPSKNEVWMAPDARLTNLHTVLLHRAVANLLPRLGDKEVAHLVGMIVADYPVDFHTRSRTA